MKQSETQLVRQCIDILHKRGCLAWRMNVGARKIGDRFVRFGFPGLSDIIGMTPSGKFLAVECKVGKNKLTPEQAGFIQRVSERGVAIIVHDDAASLWENPLL